MSELLNLATIGMSANIVGIIFLANSMGIRNPRRFIHEHFGLEREQPLRAVHHQLRVKAQIFTGFLFLILGFSLQILAVVLGAGLVPELPPGAQVRALAVLVGGVITLVVLLRLAQNAWSLLVFRRLLTEFFQEHHDWAFEKHPAETREIGEILGVASRGEDSIGDYANRVRTALKLRTGGRRPAERDDAFAPLRNVGAGRRS